MKKYDSLIIGGGASGLMCAVGAKIKKPNMSVAIIEKNPRVGKKLLSTGNGRCNLTNRFVSAEKYCGSFKAQANILFEKYNTEKLIEIFENIGLLTFCDSEGRYYPLCKQASAVLDVLRFACDRLGVEIFCDESIKSVKKSNRGFEIKTQNNVFNSEKLVIACGSKAAPKLGGNSSCSDYLKNLGHKFNPFSPALCPIKVESDILKSLKGLRASARAVLLDRNFNSVKEESGEVQFTDNALSGICIFNLSLYSKKGFIISLDLAENYSENELFNILLSNITLFADLTVDNLFTGIFQKRLGQAVLKKAGISDFSRLCKSVSSNEINQIAKTVKQMEFKVVENCGFEQAQAALGGVLGEEINESTMESKLMKNLYICGEAVDICGECGGFNLHFAFASGLVAGENL